MTPTVTAQTNSSYRCNNVEALAGWLSARGYTSVEARSSHELARLRRGGSLLVLYHSGSVLLQGADVDTAKALLATLEVPF